MVRVSERRNPPVGIEYLHLWPGSLTFARKSRALPSALSLTVVNNTAPAEKRHLVPINNQEQSPAMHELPAPAALPFAPFELSLPSSIPKPSRITNFPLQALLRLRDNKAAYLLIRVSKVHPDHRETAYWLIGQNVVRKHMSAVSVIHREKHRTDGKPDEEWHSPWNDFGSAPTELVSMLCRLVSSLYGDRTKSSLMMSLGSAGPQDPLYGQIRRRLGNKGGCEDVLQVLCEPGHPGWRASTSNQLSPHSKKFRKTKSERSSWSEAW